MKGVGSTGRSGVLRDSTAVARPAHPPAPPRPPPLLPRASDAHGLAFACQEPNAPSRLPLEAFVCISVTRPLLLPFPAQP